MEEESFLLNPLDVSEGVIVNRRALERRAEMRALQQLAEDIFADLTDEEESASGQLDNDLKKAETQVLQESAAKTSAHLIHDGGSTSGQLDKDLKKTETQLLQESAAKTSAHLIHDRGSASGQRDKDLKKTEMQLLQESAAKTSAHLIHDRGSASGQRDKDLKKTEMQVLQELIDKTNGQKLDDDDPLEQEICRVIEELRQKLRAYYRNYFPFEDMCTWLCYGNADTLCCREFSYVDLPSYFNRYKTYDTFEHMKSRICFISPVKIDIGAIFDKRPKKCTGNEPVATPVERELVFDIDLSDYNKIRSCCKNEEICQKCWKFVAAAVKIMHSSFVEDFAWKQILWVYSGRRGVHCWVCDADVRRLSPEDRKLILKYYNLERPYLISDKERDEYDEFARKPRDQFGRIHMSRSHTIAEQYFAEVCLNEQDILSTPEGVSEFTSLLPSLPCREKVIELFADCSTSVEKWNKFEEYWKSKEATHLRALRPNLLKHIVLWYMYPRIDTAVTTGMNHLLKAPFSMHPKTLSLCTPFDPAKVDKFNISEVLSLEQLSKTTKFGRPLKNTTSTMKIHLRRYAESRVVFSNFLKSLKTT